MSRQLYCIGRVDNTGNYPILGKGFVYSFTNPLPITGATNCVTVPVNTPLSPTNEFTTTIYNLPETTPYYIRSYATNIIGTSLSAIPITSGITGGIINKPTMTLRTIRKDNNLEVEAYEIGTNTEIVISGITTKNDELTFNTLTISRTSSPPIANVRTWNGLKTTFRTDETPGQVSIYFTPISTNPQSYPIIHNANYLCGNPPYNIIATTQANAVFPYLWVLMDSLIGLTPSFFNPSGPDQLSFYTRASSNPPLAAPKTNGKLVIPKASGDLVIDILPITNYNKLVFGYPKDYGDNIRFSFDGISWAFPNIIVDQTVATALFFPNAFGIVNNWTKLYRILALPISGPPYPNKFYIQHIN